MAITVNAAERMAPENLVGKSKEKIWKETIAWMEKSLTKVPEQDREAYKKKIQQKMQSGKKLSGDELNFLRMYEPDLYCSALRVENARQILRTRLKNCKSKEQVERVVSGEYEVLKAAEGDPDKEYLSAMVSREVQAFKKSNAYAKLPRTIEKDKKKGRMVSEEEIWRDEEEGISSSNARTVLGQMQVQCDKISELSESFVA